MAEYARLTDELLKLVEPGFGGRPRADFVAKVERLTREIERAGSQQGYICEKAGNVREWVRIACSHKRHAPWGLQRVEHFAYEDAYRLVGALRPGAD